jgi:hypothetical protein
MISIKVSLTVIAISGLVMVGLSTKETKEVVSAGELSPIKQQSWIRVGKDSVRSKLKDGDSAKFQNVFFNQSKDGVPVSCGQVNSKNGFGAYGGYQRYIATNRADLTFLEEQVSDFQIAWNRFCT